MAIFLTSNLYQDRVAAEVLQEPKFRGLAFMETEKKFCSICAWRANCQKRFSVVTDSSGSVRCTDYSRDLSIKEADVDTTENKCQEK
jgi:hypothetical protein